MKLFTVSFFGHRIVPEFREAEERVEALIHTLLLENEYVKLKEEIYSAIVESLYRRNISSYDRLSECLSKAASVAVTDNLLTKCEIVSVKDRQGICHHLANEKENVTWRH